MAVEDAMKHESRDQRRGEYDEGPLPAVLAYTP